MARFVAPDVFKITGGEPLLHPDIAAIVSAVREVGIAPIVRLFTNGLLLHRMPDSFWAALDQLTISHYASAPLPESRLEEFRAKAKAFDVVLNIKPVTTFSQIASTVRNKDAARVTHVYRECWLRHRCMMVRDGTFYMCTRASYADVFRTRLLRESPGATTGDGVPLAGSDFADRLLEYLNRASPLSMCGFCLESDGPSFPHTQLAAAEVRAVAKGPPR